MAGIGICNKPFTTEEVTSLAEVKTPYEELMSSNNSSYMLQFTESRTIPHMDQIKFKAQVITDPTLKLRPGTTVMVTSGIALAHYVPDRLYNVDENNRVSIRIKNTDVQAINLPKPYFIKERPVIDAWIIVGTKMTNTGTILCFPRHSPRHFP